MSVKTLEQLQAERLPRMDWRTVDAIVRNIDEDQAPVLDAYFSRFVPPSDTCISCGEDIWFAWTIAHGEGQCNHKGCGYPARAYHYDLFKTGRLTIVLQYHPDELRRVAPSQAEREQAQKAGVPS